MKITVDGYLKLQHDEKTLFLDTENKSLVELLYTFTHGKSASIRYYVTKKRIALKKIQDQHAKQLVGRSDENDHEILYKEESGYYFKENERHLSFSGEELFDDLKKYLNQYLILTIEVY